MTFPSLLLITFGMGALTAAAGHEEVRASYKEWYRTLSFRALIPFVMCVVIPISVALYVLQGDWFVLYLVDTQRVPSAVALVVFVFEGMLSPLGFAIGSALIRNERYLLVWLLGASCCLCAFLIPWLAPRRLFVVGTYIQFAKGYGLVNWLDTTAFALSAVSALALFGGASYLLLRVRNMVRR
ncbi:MAG: hypothetical protein N2515_05275 [Deltaproteobacteria bacterium]|nr:hypothetical protein [Deltaproteobacteria bacterium]